MPVPVTSKPGSVADRNGRVLIAVGRSHSVVMVNTPHPLRHRVPGVPEGIASHLYIQNRPNRVPLDLGYVASCVLSRVPGAKIKIVEANALRMESADVGKVVNEVQPKLVVINTSSFDRWTCPYPTLDHPASLAKELSRSSDAVIAAVGPHGTVFAESTLRELPGVDLLAVGEPELTMAEVAERVLADDAYTDVDGVAYRAPGGEIVVNRPRPLIEDLDALPHPAYDLLPLEPYQRYGYVLSDRYRFPGRSTFMLASRGCPYACSFCTMYMHGHRRRERSPERVVDEMELLSSRYGVGVIRFQDPEFVTDKRRAKTICALMQDRKLPIRWSVQTRYGSVDEDLLEAMSQAGCYQINYGFESGSQTVLDLAGKNQTIDEATQVIEATSAAGIHASNNVVFGLPGEDRETMEETLRYIEKISRLPHVSFSSPTLPMPYPGTRLYRMGIEQGLFRPIDSWSQFPKVLAFSGMVGTAFKSSRELARLASAFNRRVRRIYWKKDFGSCFFAHPEFWLRQARTQVGRLGGLSSRMRGRSPARSIGWGEVD